MHLGLTPWNFEDLSAASLTAQAAFGESIGYRSFWLPENHFNDNALPDPLLLLAAVAAGTRTIRLGTTSYLLPLRNPLLAAEQVALLDRLSDGRVVLGVGRGYSKETLHAFGIDPGAKRELFEWSLTLMQRAWSGQPVSLHDNGSAAVTVAPQPLQQPHPPVWVAAFGPRALAQAGRLGLPYLGSPIETFADLRANYSRYDDAVAAAGHPPITTRPLMRSVFVHEHAATIAGLRTRLATTKLPRGLSVSPEVDDWAIIGGRSYVRDRLETYRETLGLSHLIVTRLRIEGVTEPALRDSLSAVATLLS